MRVEEMLQLTSRSFPDKPVLVCEGQTYTYEMANRGAGRLAFSFISHGLQTDERVAIFMENSIETILSIFSTLKAEGIFLVISPSTKPSRLISILDDSAAVILVTDMAGAGVIEKCLETLPLLRFIYIKGTKPHLSARRAQKLLSFEASLEGSSIDDFSSTTEKTDTGPAAIIYTSGSNGDAKGVLLSRLNITFAVSTIAAYLSNTAADVILNVLPLSHSYGLTQLMTSVKVGMTLVLSQMFRSLAALPELMVAKNVTGFAMTPTIASTFVQLNIGGDDLRTLRYVTNASDSLPPTILQELLRILPRTQIFSMYGLTECIRASFLPPDQLSTRPTSIGRGLPGQQMYIVDEHGTRLGAGSIGELVIQGPHVMLGYWNKPIDSIKAISPTSQDTTVLHTGDLFRMDEEGYYYFISRKDDIIKTCGEKVGPTEVEQVLCSIDGVIEAAVMGVPDSILGQAVMAIVCLDNGIRISKREIISHCKRHLEPFKIPTSIEFLNIILRTSNGKIERRRLAENFVKTPTSDGGRTLYEQ